MMKNNLITIATDTSASAKLLQEKLESEGISCYLKKTISLYPSKPDRVQIKIHQSDVENAMRILLELKAYMEKEEIKYLKQIRRILVPTDFSDNSKNACLYALELAKVYQADLKILHVYYAPLIDLIPITDAYSIQVDMDINIREMEERTKKWLVEFVAQIRAIADSKGYEELKISYSMCEGIIEDEITRMAIQYKPGIIVMGTTGKGKKQSDIIGSVVHKVLDKSKIPILAIPQSASFKGMDSIKNIVYTTTFDHTDYVAIRKLIAIVSAFELKIHCVHISESEKEIWDDLKMVSLKEYFKKIHSKIIVECSFIKGDNPVANLEIYCEKNNVNLIAVASRKRGLLQRLLTPGITKKLLHNSTLPILLIKT